MHTYILLYMYSRSNKYSVCIASIPYYCIYEFVKYVGAAVCIVASTMCMNTVKKYCVMGGRQVPGASQAPYMYVYTCIYYDVAIRV